MSILFSTYVTPQIKDINNPEIIQKWKLNIDAAKYEKYMAKTNLPSDRKKIHRQADHNHWPASIKSTCQWFTFHAIIEYTVNIMQDRAIPNYATVKEIKSLGATFNFIDKWLLLLHENYLTRSESYSITMKEMFK